MDNINKAFEFEDGFDLGQAIAEADRCLLCYDAPCSDGCPAGTDPAKFIRKLRLRNITGAIRTIKENNILGGACGVLCPTAELCEKECCAAGLDRPIQIGKIQRFLVEYAKKIEFDPLEKAEPNGKKVAVIGSGPAGLSCAAELAKDGFGVTVFEERAEPGGVLRYGVPTYRLSKEFLDSEIDNLRKLGVAFKCESPIKDKAGAENFLKEGYGAVFIGTGLWCSIRLKETGGEIDGLFPATDFLAALREEKISEMGKHLEGKAVAVIGGGSVAIDCLESALKFGAKDAYLVYRRAYAQMPAEEDERLSAQQKGANFLLLNQPTDYVTDEKGKLKGLKIVRTKLGELDSSGRRAPVPISGSEWTLDVDTVVDAIGNQPEKGSSEWYPSVKVTTKDLISVNEETCETSVKGIFAGGDIVRGPALIVNAVADGKTAAKAIKEYLK